MTHPPLLVLTALRYQQEWAALETERTRVAAEALAAKKRADEEKLSAKKKAEEKKEAEEVKAARKKDKYTRDEFKQLITNQSTSEVLEILGKPANTQTVGDFEYWYYPRRTYDAVTNQVDQSTQLCFINGRVSSINFF